MLFCFRSFRWGREKNHFDDELSSFQSLGAILLPVNEIPSRDVLREEKSVELVDGAVDDAVVEKNEDELEKSVLLLERALKMDVRLRGSEYARRWSERGIPSDDESDDGVVVS